jgi:hypothetical protein
MDRSARDVPRRGTAGGWDQRPRRDAKNTMVSDRKASILDRSGRIFDWREIVPTIKTIYYADCQFVHDQYGCMF